MLLCAHTTLNAQLTVPCTLVSVTLGCFRMKKIVLFAFGKEKNRLCLQYKKPVAALSSAGITCSTASVCVCILCWPEQLLDALLCTLNIWLSLQDHLSSDVKTSASHLHFQSVIHKFWLLIVFFAIRGPKL